MRKWKCAADTVAKPVRKDKKNAVESLSKQWSVQAFAEQGIKAAEGKMEAAVRLEKMERQKHADFVYGLKTGLKFTFEETSLSHMRRISLEVP